MSWSSSAGAEVDQGWREMHLLCWFMHIWCKAPLPFSPPSFVSPCFPLPRFGLKPSTQPFFCFTSSHTCTSFPAVWVSRVVIQVNPDNPWWFGFALQKKLFGNLVTKSFLLAKDFMISLISSVANPSLLSHFKEPKVQSKIVD